MTRQSIIPSAIVKFFAISIALLLLLFILINSWSMIGEIHSVEDNNNLTSSKFSYFIDQSNQLSFLQIKEILNQFTPATSKSIPYKLADESYWVKVSVKNKTKQNLSLTLYADNALLDIFDSYKKINNDYIHGKIVNKEQPQPVVNLVYPHLNFNILPLDEQTFILKIKTDGPPNLPLMILTQDEFQQRILFSQIVYGSFIAIIIMMALYNVILYFAIKDKVYLVYIGYLLSSFFVLASLTGFGYLVFSPKVQELINEYLLFIDYYLVIFLLAFTLLFLRYDQRRDKVYQIGKYLSLLLICCSFYSLSLDFIEQTKLFFSLQPAIYLFALFTITTRLRNDYSWAKYYFYSWVPLLIGIAIQPLVLLNYLDYSFITSKAFLFAILAEITLMAFALASRMKRNEQDRNHDVIYHIESGLPKKLTIENKVTQLIALDQTNFSLLIIKPEQIEQIACYINDAMNTELLQRLNKHLSSLFKHNDTVMYITPQHEKICLLNNCSLAILIENDGRQQSLSTFITSIQQIVRENFNIGQLSIPLTALVGVANFPEHGEKSHQLLTHAQMSLQSAEMSPNKWAYFHQTIENDRNYLLNLANELTLAIDEDQLEIYHQPQIDLKTLRTCSSECLLRWKHDKKGIISPNVIIPLAEDLGLINKLTLWVITQALKQQLVLRDELAYNHMVSINISGKDLLSESFFRDVLNIIEHSTISCEKIVFELTESIPLDKNNKALETINKLVEVGITVSIDDFGTGHSSMSQVSELPFQELKIDQEFVENICSNEKRKIIVEANIKMAKGLGLEVVAEGINSQQDEDTLRHFGCDIGQGHFYAKAMPFDDYVDWLSRLSNGKIAPSLQGEFIPAEK